jgi:uncharacterized membrane protein
VAGIGFELKRVLRQGGVFRFIGVSLAGTAIVAGPWLLSVLGIFLIQRYAGAALAEAPVLFSAVIVYSYAFSLILFSGLHYVFTRQVSDLIYDEKNSEAGSALISFLLVTFVLATAAACGLLPMGLQGMVSRPFLFILAAAALFIATSANWVLMSFISLLRSYTGILMTYLGGSLVSFLGTFLLGRAWGTAGALLGYAAGQWLTAIVLYAMTLSRFRPSQLFFRSLLFYLSRYKMLFFAGLLYAWATWADKVVFWFAFGKRIGGSWFRMFDPYDIPIFFAILTLIPSLIYFTIETETSFYPRLREFLRCVNSEPFQKIQEKKYVMIRSLGTGLRDQGVLQAIVSLVLILTAPMLGPALFGQGINVSALQLTLGAVFFHSLFLSLVIFLFYLEMYGKAAVSTLVFFGVNLGASMAIAFMGNTRLLGTSYLAGGIAGDVVAAVFLVRSLKRFDQILFIRASRR